MVWPVPFENTIKIGYPRLYRCRDIRLKVVGHAILCIYRQQFRPEVACDMISGIDEDDVGLSVHVSMWNLVVFYQTIRALLNKFSLFWTTGYATHHIKRKRREKTQ